MGTRRSYRALVWCYWEKAVLALLVCLQKQPVDVGSIDCWCILCRSKPGSQGKVISIWSCLFARCEMVGYQNHAGCVAGICATWWNSGIGCIGKTSSSTAQITHFSTSLAILFLPASSSLYFSWISWSSLAPELKKNSRWHFIFMLPVFILQIRFLLLPPLLQKRGSPFLLRVSVLWPCLSSCCHPLSSPAGPIPLLPQLFAGNAFFMWAFPLSAAFTLSLEEVPCSYFWPLRLS